MRRVIALPDNRVYAIGGASNAHADTVFKDTYQLID